MKRFTVLSFLFTGCIILLCGCGHTHSWSEATCTEPAICADCGKTDGEALGHDFAEATCETPATCTRCGETNGEALGHVITKATCTVAATCTRCGQTSGEPLGHSFAEATCGKPSTCTLCGETTGTKLGHDYSEATCTELATCSKCGQTKGLLKDHDLVDVVIVSEPTCTEDGQSSGTCTVCGQTVTVPISKTGHTDGEYVVETKATYYSSGEKVQRCTECDEILSTQSYELTAEEKESDFKADCPKYSYEDLARDPDSVFGDSVKLTGEVIQVMEDGNNYELRVDITKKKWGYTDTIYVSYTRKDGEPRILEDDIVTLYGYCCGTISYTSVLGATITLPYVAAAYLTID
jgi:hypothetical protein